MISTLLFPSLSVFNMEDILSDTEDLSDSEDFFNLEHMEDKLQLEIPVPKISFYTQLQYKSSRRRHKGAIKLLELKSIASKKTFPKTRQQLTNTTIQEKLAEVCRKHHRRETLIKNKNFMKNDFLQELILKEDLKYLILEILPRNKCFYLFEDVRVSAKIQGMIYDDIQNESLNYPFYKTISDLMSLYSADIRDIMYNYHIILNIRKYFSSDENAQPVFSSFILLKPTNLLLVKLTQLSENDENDPLVPDLESLVKESKIFSEKSGPLYLETNPLAREFTNFLREYRYEFDCNLSKQLLEIEGSKPGLDNILPTLFEYVKGINKFKKRMKSPMGFPLQISGTVIESQEPWKKRIKRFLELREFVNPKKNLVDKYELAEIFAVKFAINTTDKTVPAQRFISVFFSDDGIFKFGTTERLFRYHTPRYPEGLFMEVGEKEILDGYILEVLSFLNQISTCGLCITYYNLNMQQEGTFYTGDKTEIEEWNKNEYWSQCIYHNSMFPDAPKKYLDIVGYDESANVDNFVRQEVIIDGFSRDAIVCYERNPYVIDVYSKIQRQKGNRDPEDETEIELNMEALIVVQNGNLKTAFEAHKFEKCENFPYKTQEENGNEIRHEFYPALFQVYECNKDDFQDSSEIIFTDEMQNFADLCSKGRSRPHVMYRSPRRR